MISPFTFNHAKIAFDGTWTMAEKHNSILDRFSQKTNQINENVNEIEESILSNSNNKRFIQLQWSIEIFPLECKWFNSFLFNQYWQQQLKIVDKESLSIFFFFVPNVHTSMKFDWSISNWILILQIQWEETHIDRQTHTYTHFERIHMEWIDFIIFLFFIYESSSMENWIGE